MTLKTNKFRHKFISSDLTMCNVPFHHVSENVSYNIVYSRNTLAGVCLFALYFNLLLFCFL